MCSGTTVMTPRISTSSLFAFAPLHYPAYHNAAHSIKPRSARVPSADFVLSIVLRQWVLGTPLDPTPLSPLLRGGNFCPCGRALFQKRGGPFAGFVGRAAARELLGFYVEEVFQLDGVDVGDHLFGGGHGGRTGLEKLGDSRIDAGAEFGVGEDRVHNSQPRGFRRGKELARENHATGDSRAEEQRRTHRSTPAGNEPQRHFR